jgi:uncharacterized protein YecE (DUF72 family)
MDFDRDQLKSAVAKLAAEGVYIGTSSWKYAGWCGQIYDREKYLTHGKFAETRFENTCLPEYAEAFKTVCVDGAYYRFPDHRYVEKLVNQVPADFLFTFKVTDEITIKKFTKLPRFRERAGKPNENFLNADLFERAFAKTFEPFKQNVGMFIFEFSKFYPSDYEHGRDFIADLDKFLGNIPKGWSYGIEVRNKNFLHPEYFAMLAKHGVAHVYNSWADMPPVSEQLALPDSMTSEKFTGARFLLKPGRKYQDAVDRFSPYEKIQEEYPEARKAAAYLITRKFARNKQGKVFIYVNNRLEGNALDTIRGILREANAD